MIAALSSVAGLSTLQALIATIPLLAVATLLATRGARTREAKARAIAVDTWRGSSRVCDEIVVVTTALILGRVLEAAVQEIGVGDMVGALALPGWAVIACVIGAITLSSLVGIHQVVSIIVVLVVFMPLETGISDVVMMEAALIGWAFASMVGVTAVSTATASAMFRVPRVQLIFGPNLVFVFAFGTLSVVLLSLANGLIFAA